MYTQADLANVQAMRKKRFLCTLVPTLLGLFVAIAVFVYGQMVRSTSLWMLTTVLTVVSGGTFLFLYGVWIRPLSLYKKHVEYMLFGKKRNTVGTLTSFSRDMADRDGLYCFAVMVNIGNNNDPMDDRLFYYDAHKPLPTLGVGTKVSIESNDKMIASFLPLQ